MITARFVNGPHKGQTERLPCRMPEIVKPFPLATPRVLVGSPEAPVIGQVHYRPVVEHDGIGARRWPLVHYEVSG